MLEESFQFIVCHAYNRHAAEMTKICNSNVFTVCMHDYWSAAVIVYQPAANTESRKNTLLVSCIEDHHTEPL